MTAYCWRPLAPGAGVIGGNKGYGRGSGVVMNPNAMVLWDKDVTLLPPDNLVVIALHEKGFQTISSQTSLDEVGTTEKKGSMGFVAAIPDVAGDRADAGDWRSRFEDVGLGSRFPSMVIRGAAASSRVFQGSVSESHASTILMVSAGLRVAPGL
ncbi:hypothetical protein NE237_000668 [Protea cynaroides]|uniref:Uncharacterized protein n=1 Tax=Protea cynaroides TaxID=273540 RepID=A0A9Q0KRM2_9MAGN|nr:hypothetical protein NE237_000668 [Protea cynaroides]